MVPEARAAPRACDRGPVWRRVGRLSALRGLFEPRRRRRGLCCRRRFASCCCSRCCGPAPSVPGFRPRLLEKDRSRASEAPRPHPREQGRRLCFPLRRRRRCRGGGRQRCSSSSTDHVDGGKQRGSFLVPFGDGLRHHARAFRPSGLRPCFASRGGGPSRGQLTFAFSFAFSFPTSSLSGREFSRV